MNTKRWINLGLGSLTLLLGGLIYSWSILKSPLAEEFGWTPTQLAFNFTVTICFFGIGGLVSGIMSKKIGVRGRLIISAVLVFLGFFIASRVQQGDIALLYIAYGVAGGTGIGIMYNTIISTVGAWFPDKKGLSSGILLMCFGFSTLIFGGLAGRLIASDYGWRSTYILLGCLMGGIVLLAGIIMKAPSEEERKGLNAMVSDGRAKVAAEIEGAGNLSAKEMLKRVSFWKLFISLTLLSSIGNVAISFAKDFAIFTGAEETMAITLVGVLSVFNGVGRICAGAIYDKLSIFTTQKLIAGCMIIAPLMGMLAASTASEAAGIAALILCGFSYGLCPTSSAVYPKILFGEKNYALNFSITNLTLIPTSFVATLAGAILTSTGSYLFVYLMLCVFACIGSILLLSIRKA